MRHKFALTFLKVLAINKQLFFFQILTGAKYNFSSYGSEGANRSPGIIFRFFADVRLLFMLRSGSVLAAAGVVSPDSVRGDLTQKPAVFPTVGAHLTAYSCM